MNLQLWDQELASTRDEWAEVLAAMMPLVSEFISGEVDPSLSLGEQAQLLRDAMAAVYQNDPDAEDREIAGVPCRVFRPSATPRATYVHFHGGGMVIGAPALSDDANRQLAEANDVAVISVDYRLAPEHPFPAGLDDGVAVATWVAESAVEEFGSGRMILGGESAGGYLAAAVALRLRDQGIGQDALVGLNLNYGVFDWGGWPSERPNRPDDGPDLLTPELMAFFADCYLPGRSSAERRTAECSPSYADLAGLVPALVTVGTLDHLFDESMQLATRMAAAGNAVELCVVPGAPHGFHAFPCPAQELVTARANTWFDQVLGPR